MNATLEDAAVQRDLPAVWELLRAASGLVAVVALVGVVVAMTVFAWDEDEPGMLVAAAVQAPPPEAAGRPAIVSPNSLPAQAVFVFYLVATPQQAEVADWGEQVGAHERISAGVGWTDRHYEIHFARDDDEERTAGRAVLERIVNRGDVSLVEVIDLRQINAPATTSLP